MSSDVVKQRELRVKYQTNRDIKAYSLFVWLKNMTPAGVIHNYEKQHAEICQALKISRASFYNYLRTAETLKLIVRQNGNLKLSGWDKVIDQFTLPSKTFTTIYYDTENPKQKLSLIIEALEFEENKEKQQRAITNKIAKNPSVKSAFELFCQYNNIQAEFTPDNLAIVRRLIFQNGTAESIYSSLMYSVNPEFYRNSSSIAAAHGYKSPRLTTYLKHKLQKSGVAIIKKGNKQACSYKNNRIDGKERGKNENGTLYYKVNEKQKVWFEPDQVIISKFLFNPPPAPEPQNPQI